MKKILFFFLILVLLSFQVSSLKVSGRIVVNFEPGGTFENDLCVIPEGVYHVKLEPRGPVSEFIDINNMELDLSNGPRCIHYKVTMPDEMEPGLQKSGVKVTEKTSKSASTIAALVSIDHQIWIDVPYPGKYLTTKFSAVNAEENNPIEFNAIVTSKGVELIRKVEGIIEIYDFEGSLVGKVATNSVFNVNSQTSHAMTSTWDSTGNPVGDYKAVLKLDYDGSVHEFETLFKIGSLEVRLTDYTKSIYKKGVVPFNVFVDSYWSQQVNGVRASIDILKDGVRVSGFDTLMTSMKPWTKSTLAGYVDTTVLDLGMYDLEIKLFYESYSKIYNGSLEVAEEPVIEVETPGFIERISSSMTTTKILLSSTIILTIIAFLLVLKIFFGGKKPEKEKKVPGENPPRFEKV